MRRSCWRSGLLALVFGPLLATASMADYREHPEARSFVDQMVSKHGFERKALLELLGQAERRQNILDLIARPAERTLTWAEYRRLFITEERIEQGLVFWEEHAATLARAEEAFGVPAEVIVAVLGVETRYGRNKGIHRVLDALATLGFDYPPRATFFRGQLEQYLLLVREQGFDPLEVKGSYAGAMGYGQFIPGSYRHYAVDFDGDGVVDIVDNVVDAIGSIANYFKVHRWRTGEPVLVRAELQPGHDGAGINPPLRPPQRPLSAWAGDGIRPLGAVDRALPADPFTVEGEAGQEAWLGLHNFYVITRYNHSRLYAMAVYELSRALAERRG